MGWININEQQPVINQEVLIYERDVFFVSHWDGTKYKEHYCFPDYQDEQPGFYFPTHWMPLPPRPEI